MISVPGGGHLDGGDWELRGCLGASWERQVGPGASPEGWFPATVPGSVLDDAARAGMIPDPYAGLNSLACEWVAERAWVYRCRLRAGQLRADEHAVLRFGGVDPGATVWVDGELAGRHDGMYGAFDVDITGHLRDGGEHLLAVAVAPAPHLEAQVGRTSRVRLHKTRMVYGWDFCPRLPHQGIWRPVQLEIWSGVRLRGLEAVTVTSTDLRQGRLEVTAGLETDGSPDAELTLRLLAGGEVAGQARQTVAEAAGPGRLELRLPRPRLWWPNGMGQQHLYRAELTLSGPGITGAGASVDVGFRTLEPVPNPGGPPDARPYTFAVNGHRMFARGWNWVPLDAQYGVPRPAKLAHLLTLAARARVNLLRVWGGGLIESEDFYRHCDRLGLLVWQEFSLSSSLTDSEPPGDPEFVAYLAGEAARVVPGLRHHPSLALWCGGNELAADGVPLDDTAPALAGLRDAVARLDPGRPWLPTSPSGPSPENRLAAIAADPDGQHDVHGPWEHQGLSEHHRLYNAGTALLHSEFGVEGMTNRRALDALITPGRQWPPGRDNPVYAHLGAWWNNLPLVRETFGDRLAGLDAIRRASQYLQADGLRYAVEAARRRAPRCSGTIPWQFNESYPNAWCTAAVDHRGDPKPAYYWVGHAYRSPWVSAAFERQTWAGSAGMRAVIWAGADWPDTLTGVVTARVVSLDGAVGQEASWKMDSDDGSPRPLGDFTASLAHLPGEVFLLEVGWQGAADDKAGQVSRYLMTKTRNLGPVLDAGHASLEVSSRCDGDRWELELAHRGGPAALGIVLEDDRPYKLPGWAVFGDNLIDLLPGERRRVDVSWHGAPAAGRRLRAGGWNTGVLAVP